MKCTKKCEYWYFGRKLPTGRGPMCDKYQLPLLEAREKCASDREHLAERKRQAKKKREEKPVTIQSEPWPGSLRGWGPITKEV